jgi:peptide-methionine (S)-S-oxide reductase
LPVAFALLAALFAAVSPAAERPGSLLPKPAVDEPRATASGQQTIVLAGGCFWGIQAVYQHTKGVTNAVSGYAGGSKETADYQSVSYGRSAHAEAVQVTYDPRVISYGQLLQIFFSVAHDPTQLNRQGPDEGSQYRSAIFYNGDEQKRIAEAYIAQLNQAEVFSRQIVTQVVTLKAFYPAEAYHQDYATRHADNPYIVYNDAPKVAHLREQFPDLYKN